MRLIPMFLAVQVLDPYNKTVVREFLTQDWKEANKKLKDWQKRFPKNPVVLRG